MDINYIIDNLTPERRVFYWKHKDKIQLRFSGRATGVRHDAKTGTHTVYGKTPADFSHGLDWIRDALNEGEPIPVRIDDLVEDYPMWVIPVEHHPTDEMMQDLIGRFESGRLTRVGVWYTILIIFRYGFRAGMRTKYNNVSGKSAPNRHNPVDTPSRNRRK